MGYIGNNLQVAFPTYLNIDDISGSFDGVTTSFPLTVGGVAPVPAPLSSNQCLISVGGVVQKPDDTGTEGFLLSGGNIVFSAAPAALDDFFGVILAGADYVNVGVNFPSGSSTTPSITFDTDLDTGVYNAGANELGFTTSGTERFRITSAGQIRASTLGTASSPALVVGGDINSGLYSPGADQVALSTAGEGRLFIDASGNVGVGAASPGGTLYIKGGNADALFLDNAGEQYTLVEYKNNGSLRAQSYYDETAHVFGHYLPTANSPSFIWKQGSSERLRITSTGTLMHLGAGNSTTPAVQFNGSAPVNSLVIDSSGRVGLGTSTPGGQLEIFRTSTTDPSLRLRYNSTSYYGDHLMDGNGNYIIYSPAANGVTSGNLRLRAGSLFSISTNDQAATSPALTIDTSSRVGIGTTSPGALLDVTGSNGRMLIANGTASNSMRLSAQNATGTGNAALVFESWNLEYGRFDTSGRLLVGTSNTSQSSGDGVKINPSGQVWVVSTGGDTFSAYNGGYKFYVDSAGVIAATSATITVISDQRFKENIRDLDDGLNKILALQPRKFDWKEGRGNGKADERGFIAQEFEQVFPDLINEWKDEAPEGEEPYKAVRADLIPVLVKAIQEQQALIAELQTEVAALKTQ